MFKTLRETDVDQQRVLLRADLNTPLTSDGDKRIVSDDFRIRASLDTIRDLRNRGAITVVASHLGRPEGADPHFSMAPVSERLGELGGFAVRQLGTVIGPEVDAALAEAKPGDVLVLENTRFHEGETSNDEELGRPSPGTLTCLYSMPLVRPTALTHRWWGWPNTYRLLPDHYWRQKLRP